MHFAILPKDIQINAIFLLYHRVLLFISYYKNNEVDFKATQAVATTGFIFHGKKY